MYAIVYKSNIWLKPIVNLDHLFVHHLKVVAIQSPHLKMGSIQINELHHKIPQINVESINVASMNCLHELPPALAGGKEKNQRIPIRSPIE
jgi:hypothetical protein